MVDTGSRSQSADESLKNHLSFHIHTCDFLLLGGTHDGGYAAAPHRLDPDLVRRKIVLLRTTPFCAPRLCDIGLEEAHFPGLFDGRDPRGSKGGKSGGTREHSSASVSKAVDLNERELGHGSDASSSSDSTSPVRMPLDTTKRQGTNVNLKTLQIPQQKAFQPDLPPSPPPFSNCSIPCAPHSSTYSLLSKFRPLIEILLQFRDEEDMRPLRSSVGTLLSQKYPGLYGPFKIYAAEAEAAGVVRLGKAAILGSEWIELAIPSSNLLPPLPASKPSTPHYSGPSRLPTRFCPPSALPTPPTSPDSTQAFQPSLPPALLNSPPVVLNCATQSPPLPPPSRLP
ncbi:hypothetical protein P7C70_g3439, partial [Phenoliferia sp. Uapishka_3]